jgi:hypothetical protein
MRVGLVAELFLAVMCGGRDPQWAVRVSQGLRNGQHRAWRAIVAVIGFLYGLGIEAVYGGERGAGGGTGVSVTGRRCAEIHS